MADAEASKLRAEVGGLQEALAKSETVADEAEVEHEHARVALRVRQGWVGSDRSGSGVGWKRLSGLWASVCGGCGCGCGGGGGAGAGARVLVMVGRGRASWE